MWQTSDGEVAVWRASLESPGSGEQRGFRSLQDLFAYLEAQARSADQVPAPDRQEQTGKEV
jgi:hypothetical protein